MKVINDGFVKLYRYNFTERVTEDHGNFRGYSELPFQNYYVERYEHLLLVSPGRKAFKKSMIKFFIDNEELVNKIRNEELKYEDLATIVRIYNRNPE